MSLGVTEYTFLLAAKFKSLRMSLLMKHASST